MMYAGIDIGGTKCAVVLGDDHMNILHKVSFPTTDVESVLSRIEAETADILASNPVEAIGISCGGPLDSRKGIIQSPPNLPGWDNIPITERLTKRFGVPSFLCNDANAYALAEWRHGAGQGAENMIFMTFGTGLGAGVILNNRLYSGSTGNAGEAGHLRLALDGPIGYGKKGSFEGFCSGGGLRQLGVQRAREKLLDGHPLPWCPDEAAMEHISAKLLSDWARKGDPDALDILAFCGRQLGKGLSILMDLFDPDVIVIGSIYTRCEDLLRPYAMEVIESEVLPAIAAHCRLKPAMLGEQIGDIAALSVAQDGLLHLKSKEK